MVRKTGFCSRSAAPSSAGDPMNSSFEDERLHNQLLQQGNDLKEIMAAMFSLHNAQKRDLMNLKNENEMLKEKLLKLENEKLEKKHRTEMETWDIEKNALAAKLVAFRKQMKEKVEVLVAIRKELKEKHQGLRNKGGNADDDVVIEVVPKVKIDHVAFKEALKRILLKRFTCSQWQHPSLDDPQWHPFRIVPIEGSDGIEEILDLKNERLARLRIFMGNEADSILLAALEEGLNKKGQRRKRCRYAD